MTNMLLSPSPVNIELAEDCLQERDRYARRSRLPNKQIYFGAMGIEWNFGNELNSRVPRWIVNYANHNYGPRQY